MLQHVGGLLPSQHRQTLVLWLTSACEQKPGKQQHPGLAKALFQGIFALSGAPRALAPRKESRVRRSEPGNHVMCQANSDGQCTVVRDLYR